MIIIVGIAIFRIYASGVNQNSFVVARGTVVSSWTKASETTFVTNWRRIDTFIVAVQFLAFIASKATVRT
jgi:hypothetical protein